MESIPFFCIITFAIVVVNILKKKRQCTHESNLFLCYCNNQICISTLLDTSQIQQDSGPVRGSRLDRICPRGFVGSSPTGQHIRKNQPDGWFFLCFSGFNEIVSPSFLYILFFALFIQPLINVQGCPCILQRIMGVKVISKMMGGMFQAHPSSFIILIREDIHRIICPV